MNELSETGAITNESQMGSRLPSSLRRGNNCRNDADHRRDEHDYLYYRGQFQKRATDNPAVILLDLKLPKVDGLEVLKQVKSDEKLRMIPVVVLTS
jgi:CheY-like chemotaxis protein